jgi:hypothetical protein
VVSPRVAFRYVGATPWQKRMSAPFLLRLIYALSLLGGAWTHVRILAAHGLLWDYGGVPVFTRVFWTSLTFLDPLAAVLLFLRPRIGLVMTVGIIVMDVAHNAWFLTHVGPPLRGYVNWMFISQVSFLLFVLITIRIAWRGLSPPPQAKEPPHAL